MNRLILFLLCTTLLFSCDNKVKKLQNEAETQLMNTLKEVAYEPESIKLSEIRTVYCVDSLCIMHFNLKAKNKIGLEISNNKEYIYYSCNNNNKYEALVDMDADSVYISNSVYEKKKNKSFYKNLSYDETIAYRSLLKIIQNGRPIGESNPLESTQLPTGTGLWELKYYVDDFGDETESSFLQLWGNGYFSNSAASNSEMSARIILDKNSVRLQLIEYTSLVVKEDGFYEVSIKDAEDNITEFLLYNSDLGYMIFIDSQIDRFKKLVQKGGILKFYVIHNNKYTTNDTYTFKMDVTGYENAIQYLN